MNSYINSLEKKFIAIKNKGWIKTMRNGRNLDTDLIKWKKWENQ